VNSPLVSVIIPAYNRSDYLMQCLESVAHQTYTNIELIVVDDASEENIQSVVNSIEYPFPIPPQYVRMTENGGPGIAREAGRKIATGDYICYLDSDDLWHEAFVATLLQGLLNNPSAGMSYCDPIAFSSLMLTGNEKRKRHRPVKKILPYPLYRRPWHTCSVMWTREAMERIGPWSAYRFGEDTLLDIRAGCLDISPVYIPNPLFYFRQHKGPRLSTPSAQTFHARVLFTKDILTCIIEHQKHKDRLVADHLALFLLRSLSGTIIIDRKSVGKEYIALIRTELNTDFVLKSLAYLHLFFLNIPSKRVSRQLCRIVPKHIATRYVLWKWKDIYTGWDKFGL